MGLSVGITGAIMLFTFLITLTIIPFTLEEITDSGVIAYEKVRSEDVVLKTKIEISSMTVNENSDSMSFTLTNTSTEKIWNYEKFDVIVTYDIGGSSIQTDVLSYDTSCPPSSGSWCIDQFVDDNLDPTVLNPDESIVIDIDLTQQVTTNGIARLIVSTDSGVNTSRSAVGQ